MLLHLRVKDLVLIEELDMELSSGFNVLTGETGAGKSLVVTAFDLLLGRRASSGLVRKGASEAEIEGLFDVADEAHIRARLTDAGLPAHEELLIRRVIPSEGRHKCYINGRLSSLAILSDLAGGLASIMGQHEHHSLLESANQLAMLDGFGGHEKLLDAMATAHGKAREAETVLRDLEAREHDRAGRLDYIQFQIGEIDDLSPAAGELEELGKEVDLLKHQGVLLKTARRGAQDLYESDGSVFEKLGSLTRALEEVTRFDETLAQDARQLAEATVLVEEAARSLSAYGGGLEANPERLEELEDRREALTRLVRKHGVDLAGVLELRESLRSEMETLSRYEDSMTQARDTLESRREAAKKQSRKLTAARRKASAKLGVAVTRELVDLSFEKATFEARISPGGGHPTASGADTIDFLVALNPGEGAHPLRKVASGGELSRMMLALKRVLAGVGPVGTYVFDEVDAGIGGAVANAVGRKLQEVGKHHQVICVTHLPQISAMASNHFHVSKEERQGRTMTVVDRLNQKARVDEIARMLGGEKITPKIRAAAKELFGGR